MFYCLCAVARLAFFNVLEAKRQLTEGGANKTYRGLPVTSIAFILPLTFWLQFVLPELAFFILLHAVLLVVGILFILDFTMPKLSLKAIIAMSAVLAFTVGIIFVYTRFRVPAPSEETNPIIEEIEEIVEQVEEEYDQAS